MKDFQTIVVARTQKRKVEVISNPTPYPLIGIGTQGAVFKLDSKRCVKLYPKSAHARRERKSLKATKGSKVFPKLYEAGSNFVVMEYIDGPTLEEVLKTSGEMNEEIAKKILFILNEMKRLKFTRIDTRLRHILVNKKGEYKVIDNVNAYFSKRKTPSNLLESIANLQLLDSFLSKVKKLDPKMYKEWGY